MPDLLIRGLDEGTMQALKNRAKRNGHTQQEEASEIISDAVVDRRIGCYDSIKKMVEENGGVDFELPSRDMPIRYPNGIFNEDKNVLLGITGSVSAYKAVDIVKALQEHGCDVKVVMTKDACEFITPLTMELRSGHSVLMGLYDDTETKTPHCHYASMADVFVIAPASANTIAKVAHGFADNALTATCLACTCKKIVAPAMNTHMYEDEATQHNLQILRERGFEIVEPQVGKLACGDEGIGKLAEVDEIVDRVMGALG